MATGRAGRITLTAGEQIWDAEIVDGPRVAYADARESVLVFDWRGQTPDYRQVEGTLTIRLPNNRERTHRALEAAGAGR
jgi:hypothetical protein